MQQASRACVRPCGAQSFMRNLRSSVEVTDCAYLWDSCDCSCAAVQFEIESSDFARINILIKCYRSSMAVVIHVRYNRNDSGL